LVQTSESTGKTFKLGHPTQLLDSKVHRYFLEERSEGASISVRCTGTDSRRLTGGVPSTTWFGYSSLSESVLYGYLVVMSSAWDGDVLREKMRESVSVHKYPSKSEQKLEREEGAHPFEHGHYFLGRSIVLRGHILQMVRRVVRVPRAFWQTAALDAATLCPMPLHQLLWGVPVRTGNETGGSGVEPEYSE
jgi:hypothetical protein